MTSSRKHAACADVPRPQGKWRLVLAALPALLLVLPHVASAWSEAGHVAIAEASIRQLPQREQRHLNRLASTLLAQNIEVSSRFATGLSPFARSAAWLDSLRGVTVTEIFTRYGRDVPRSLRDYAGSTTDDWHYSNRFVAADDRARQCEPQQSGELVGVLPKLQSAFREAAHRQDRAIVLAMLVHLVSDAHQPLHTLARLDANCRHDRGGNSFCLHSRAGDGRCSENLHRLWDTGLGLFEGSTLQATIASLAPEGSGDTPEPVELVFAVGEWQAENLALAEAVYATPEGQPPNQVYRSNGQHIARHRAELAANRLAVVVGELVDAAQIGDTQAEPENSGKGR